MGWFRSPSIGSNRNVDGRGHDDGNADNEPVKQSETRTQQELPIYLLRSTVGGLSGGVEAIRKHQPDTYGDHPDDESTPLRSHRSHSLEYHNRSPPDRTRNREVLCGRQYGNYLVVNRGSNHCSSRYFRVAGDTLNFVSRPAPHVASVGATEISQLLFPQRRKRSTPSRRSNLRVSSGYGEHPHTQTLRRASGSTLKRRTLFPGISSGKAEPDPRRAHKVTRKEGHRGRVPTRQI